MPVHQESRQMPYQAQQIFDLVADVGAYPQFLPWCSGARIRSRLPDGAGIEVIEADLVISFKLFRERFGSRVRLDHNTKSIQTEYLDGPFKYLRSNWVMKDGDGPGCQVDFDVDFEFKSKILQGVIGLVFNEAMQRIVKAFEARAVALYGAR